jgi:hypothetical protein
MDVSKEEIFGPVTAITKFRTEEVRNGERERRRERGR